MPFLKGEVGGISKHVPTVQKESRASSCEQHVFDVPHLFFFIHGLRRFDSLFRASGENDVCDVCMYICIYIYTRTCLYGYIRTWRWILLVKVSNL